jgi:hypothetical protein
LQTIHGRIYILYAWDRARAGAALVVVLPWTVSLPDFIGAKLLQGLEIKVGSFVADFNEHFEARLEKGGWKRIRGCEIMELKGVG